jgi:hypothetical protein
MELPPPDALWEVDQNKTYIDVRLRHIDSGDRVIIETKWNAPEREKQVIGYWRKERIRARRPRIPTVFLTPTGRAPNVGPAEPDHDLFWRDLIQLSYSDDFANLLRDAALVDRIAAPRVRETLRQYIDLLQDLTDAEEEQA